jgi:hypothetical protein
MRTLRFFSCVFGLVALGACDPAPATTYCTDIIDACHEVDPGSGPISECHDLAHELEEADCEPRHDECVALCEAAPPLDGGADHDAGAHDHDAGAHDHDGGAHDHDGG